MAINFNLNGNDVSVDSESLWYELGNLGIGVKIIEPGGVATDFGGRSMDFSQQEGLTDYDEMSAQFQANMAAAGLGGSTPEVMAEGIYEAATDGKTQLRYLLGDDAVEMYAMRKEHGDDGFMAGMKQRMFS